MRSTMAMLMLTTLGLGGCAAVFKGSKQDVKFVAVPEGSDVRVDGQYKGETPTTAAIDRNTANNIQVSKDGFAPQYVRVQRHADTAWWFWDIATCAVPITLCIPVLVDALSGAWFSYDDELRVKLDPLPMTTRPAPQPVIPAAPPPGAAAPPVERQPPTTAPTPAPSSDGTSL